MQRFQNFRKIAGLILLAAALNGCEDVINVDLKEGESQLIVDAIITDDAGPQTIKLRKSGPYLDNAPLVGAGGALVKVTDFFSREFVFVEVPGTGNYVWTPGPNDTLPFGFPMNIYTLSVEYQGEKFTATSFMDSVLAIDSLGYNFLEESIFGGDTIEAGYELTMKAFDIPGEGNCYWWRTYRNGVRYSAPSEINLSFDAAFGPGSDGVEIIPPIVSALTPERFAAGDSIVVEVYSIGIPMFSYLIQAQTQMTNSGLFATPPANVPTNIQNTNSGSKIKALGWFGMVAVERKGVRIKP